MFRAQSVRSLKSVRTECSKSATTTGTNASETNGPIDFEDFIQQAVAKFAVPVSVEVVKEYQRDQYTKLAKASRKKFKRESVIMPLADLPSNEDEFKSVRDLTDDHTLIITAHYDICNRLIEIQMNNFQYLPIPRVLMQLLGLIVPYNRHLYKFVIKHCRINMYTIHELKKILFVTNITDVCLDHSLVVGCNYDILLSQPSCLRSLSLARCKIDDVVCEKLAARLHHLEPVETTLVTLNLSSNNITDAGVAHLAVALRTNRHLRYLNLADNHISDEGATLIFGVLSEFQLTDDENLNKIMRHVSYYRSKQIMTKKCMQHFLNKSDDDIISRKSIKKSSARSKVPTKKDNKKSEMNEDDFKIKAQMMAEDLLGPFEDPFSSKHMTSKVVCNGNLALCYLNLAYNNLSYTSIPILLRVVLGQKPHKTDRHCGLLYVILDGNYMPEECPELSLLNKELRRAVLYYESKHMYERGYSKRKSTLTGDKKYLLPSRP